MAKLKVVSRYVLAFFFIGAGVNHFWHPDFYLGVMPPYLPWHLELVYLSGAVEVVLGALLLDPKCRSFAAWGMVALLLSFFLVHIHMLVDKESYPEIPPVALWLRLVIQCLFVAWAWWHTGRDAGASSA